ncbi:MAG TPA: MaoC family dehydratase [Candidatus Dormibacteraeota bacterium]|nr:MaoC family dehydratase [Candidatus Dormibacteraeota bacterium]
MTMLTVPALDALPGLVGSELGTSEWYEVTQEQVELFAHATGDHQWIHVDPERAAAGPFGAPIAHGHLTLSLIPVLMSSLVKVEGVRLVINYGLNRVRFPSPVRVGSRVRGSGVLKEATEIAGGVQVVFEVTVQIDGGDKPACVAETVARYMA